MHPVLWVMGAVVLITLLLFVIHAWSHDDWGDD